MILGDKPFILEVVLSHTICIPVTEMAKFHVAGTWDRFWGCHHLTLLHLAVKLSHVGADVDGLACRLHRSMDYG
jgi:hypothetical protein